MKTLLIGIGHENIGLQYLSSFLKQHYQKTKIINVGISIQDYYLLGRLLNKLPYSKKYISYIIKQVKNYNPDLIAFSVTTDHYLWAKTLSNEIKKQSNVKIIFGGPHPSAVPHHVIAEDFVDYVCVGEGEEPLLELVLALEQNKPTDNILNIWSKKNGSIIKNNVRPPYKNLDELPFPDRDNFFNEYKNYTDVYSIITARGCPYKCTFCANTVNQEIYKNYSYVRRRSPENVILELKAAKKQKIKHVLFADDIFTLKKSWLKKFLALYSKEISLPFTCEIHPAHVDKEIIKWLEDANCASAGFGLQSAGEKIRNEILKRDDSLSQIQNTINMFKDSPIYLYVDILLNVPSQDKEELILTATFLNKYKPDMILPFNLKYYPKLPITDYAFENKLLTSKNISEINNGQSFSPFSIGKNTDKETATLSSLILGARLLPKPIFDIVIKYNLYRFNITLTNFFFHIYCILSDICLIIIKRKRMFFYFPLSKQLKYYIISMFRINFNRMSK